MQMLYRIAAGIAVVALAAGLAQARQAWDQDAVNSLASDLAAATRALKETVRREPQIAEGAQTGEPNVALFLESIDALGKSARRLTRALVDNKGYEDTLPIATKIRGLVGDAEQYGAGVMTTAWMQEKIEPVEELLAKIGAYYFE
jgi:hypothetical protein